MRFARRIPPTENGIQSDAVFRYCELLVAGAELVFTEACEGLIDVTAATSPGDLAAT